MVLSLWLDLSESNRLYSSRFNKGLHIQILVDILLRIQIRSHPLTPEANYKTFIDPNVHVCTHEKRILTLEMKLCPANFPVFHRRRVHLYHENTKRKPLSGLPQVHQDHGKETFLSSKSINRF